MKGIIMSGNHPKLILDGIKTMTRRTWGLEKINANPDNWDFVYHELGTYYFEPKDKHCIAIMIKCPYGQVGDRLWCKETWGYGYTNQYPDRVIYKADNISLPTALERGTYSASAGFGKWAPSIHMFRKDSRISLEITREKVARTQGLTLVEAIAEGYSSIEEANKAFLKLAHLPEGSNSWNWAIFYKEVSND